MCTRFELSCLLIFQYSNNRSNACIGALNLYIFLHVSFLFFFHVFTRAAKWLYDFTVNLYLNSGRFSK